MVRVNARYAQGQLVLEQPLDLPEGAEVVIDIQQVETDEQQAWELACLPLKQVRGMPFRSGSRARAGEVPGRPTEWLHAS